MNYLNLISCLQIKTQMVLNLTFHIFQKELSLVVNKLMSETVTNLLFIFCIMSVLLYNLLLS